MNYTNGCISLELPENNSESVKYTVPSLPICSVKSNQSDKNLSITEIAEQCGFSSPSYFAETFRRIIGTNLGEYSKNI